MAEIICWPRGDPEHGFGFIVERIESSWVVTYTMNGTPLARVGFDTRDEVRDEINALFLDAHGPVCGLS